MPATKITKRTVDAAQPGGKEQFFWDTDLPGFGLRVWPSGRKTFLAQYRVNGGRAGKTKRVTIGSYPLLKVDDARLQAHRILAKARLGEDTAKARDEARVANTLNDLIDVWLSEAAHLNRRTGAPRKQVNIDGEIGRIDAHIRPLLGRCRLNDLSRADIERFRDQIANGASKATHKTKLRGRANVSGGHGAATRTVRLLSSIFAFAVDRKLIEENPVRGVRLTPSASMNRFLSQQELSRLGGALCDMANAGAHPYGITIVRLLALTGARRSEIAGLRWTELDLDRGFLRLEESKTGSKIITLSPPALVILQSLNRQFASAYVFPASSGRSHYQNLGKLWSEARRRAQLPGVRLHDLRHTFASFGAAGGLGLPVIGALLGHSQASTTQRYAHLSNDPVRAAADRIGNAIHDAMATPASSPKSTDFAA